LERSKIGREQRERAGEERGERREGGVWRRYDERDLTHLSWETPREAISYT
jgi:hypothetical protein